VYMPHTNETSHELTDCGRRVLALLELWHLLTSQIIALHSYLFLFLVCRLGELLLFVKFRLSKVNVWYVLDYHKLCPNLFIIETSAMRFMQTKHIGGFGFVFPAPMSTVSSLRAS
jgi:hypothetical protein